MLCLKTIIIEIANELGIRTRQQDQGRSQEEEEAQEKQGPSLKEAVFQ